MRIVKIRELIDKYVGYRARKLIEERLVDKGKASWEEVYWVILAWRKAFEKQGKQAVFNKVSDAKGIKIPAIGTFSISQQGVNVARLQAMTSGRFKELGFPEDMMEFKVLRAIKSYIDTIDTQKYGGKVGPTLYFKPEDKELQRQYRELPGYLRKWVAVLEKRGYFTRPRFGRYSKHNRKKK